MISIDIYLIAYPSQTLMNLAAALEKRLLLAGKQVRFGTMVDSEHFTAPLIVLLFPILGDERIPDLAEQWMMRRASSSPSIALCISGDFPRYPPPNQSIAWESNRLLAKFGTTYISDPIYISTPIVDLERSAIGVEKELLIALSRCQSGGRAPLPRASPDRFSSLSQSGTVVSWRENVKDSKYSNSASGNSNLSTEPALKKITGLLRDDVQCVLNDSGECVSLSLVNTANYPRSLLVGLDRNTLHTVFESIVSLKKLEELSIAFVGTIDLPPLPKQINRLDLRGTRPGDWKFLRELINLKYINVAACDLSVVPGEIENLRNLRGLHLYKNRLESLPQWLTDFQQLQYIMLYRNRLTTFPIQLLGCSNLLGINMGANQVADLPMALSRLEKLEILGVRLLPFKSFPEVLKRLPQLKTVDFSGTPYAASVETEVPGVLSSSTLPKWW